MPALGPHQNLFVPMPLRSPRWGDLYTAATLCRLAFYWRQTPLVSQVGRWLGYSNFRAVETPGPITCNFLLGSDQDGTVVVFNGTDDSRQLLEFIMYSAQTRDPEVFGRIHSAFLSIFYSAKEILDPLLPPIASGHKLCFTGHSLGGAISQIAAQWYKRNTEFYVQNCLTFASPIVGDSEFNSARNPNFYCMVRALADLVPFLPPAYLLAGTSYTANTGPGSVFNYQQSDPQWLVAGLDFSSELTNQEWSEGITGHAVLSALLGPTFGTLGSRERVTTNHFVNNYTRILRGVAERRGHGGNITDVDQFNAALDELDRQTAATGVREVLSDEQLRNYITVSSPLPPPTATPPPLPTPQVVNRVAVILSEAAVAGPRTTVASNILPGPPAVAAAVAGGQVFAGAPRTHWLFRGADRRLLEKSIQALRLIRERDNRVAVQESMAGLSNRMPIIDPQDAQLVDDFSSIMSQVEFLLGLHYLAE